MKLRYLCSGPHGCGAVSMSWAAAERCARSHRGGRVELIASDYGTIPAPGGMPGAREALAQAKSDRVRGISA